MKTIAQNPSQPPEMEEYVIPVSSQDKWFSLMFRAVERGDTSRWEETKEQMLAHLRSEAPSMMSITFERWCNLMASCKHCIFQPERSSDALARTVPIQDIICNIARQLPEDMHAEYDTSPKLLHEGRVLRPWHVEVMAAAQKARPELMLSLVDNGSFVKHIDAFRTHGVSLDGISISLDGTEAVHNAQRDSSGKAFAVAIEGMRRARTIAREVSCPYTITSINAHDLEATAELVLATERGTLPLANAIDFTTMSPERDAIAPYECSVEDLRTAWQQYVRLAQKWNTEERERVFFRLYRHQDFEKLAYAIGAERFWEAFTDVSEGGRIRVEKGRLSLLIDGVKVTYSPLSLWPNETFYIDADGAQRTAYSLKHTLAELQSGRAANGDDTSDFSVQQLDPETPFADAYTACVDTWWRSLGEKYLAEELAMLQRIKAASETHHAVRETV